MRMPSATPLERVLHAAIAHRRVVAAVAIVVVAIASVASARLQVRNDLAAFFADGDPAVSDYETFKARFGTDEVVVVDLGPAHDKVDDAFAPARVAELSTLSQTLARVPGVARALSLATVDLVKEGADGAAVVPARTDLDEARRQAGPAGALARLVDDTRTHQHLWLWFSPEGTTDQGRREALAGVFAAVEPLRAVRPVRVVGGGVVWEALNALTVRDGAVFISLAAFVLFFGLWRFTRRLLWPVVAVVAVSCANTIVFAAMALSGTAMNAITVCLPSLVMALAVLDLVHVIAAIDTLDDDVTDPRDRRVTSALANVITPGLFNIATTSVALLALVTATSAVTRQLGAFAALGVVLAWVFCVAWTIVALPRALRGRRRRAQEAASAWTTRVASHAVARPWPILVAAVLVMVASVVGITRLTVDTDTLGFLPRSHQVHQDVRAVEASVGPFIPLEVDVTFHNADAWQRVSVIDGLQRVKATLATTSLPAAVGDVRLGVPVSVVDVLDPADRALGGGGLTRGALDDDRAGAAVAFIEVTAPQLMDGLVSADGKHLRVTVPVTLTTAQGFIAASAHVCAVVEEALVGTGATVRLTGYLPLYARIVDALVLDQVRSFAAAFVSVFVLIGLLLRSRRLMLLAALPNLVPIAFVLGLMGFLSIPLDVASVTIAATILGVIVDDTVHTLFHLRRGLRAGLSPNEAIVRASTSAGRANAWGNGLLLAGFLVLTFASARSLVLVGGLSAVAVAIALIADLLVVPALAAVVLKPRVSTPDKTSPPTVSAP